MTHYNTEVTNAMNMLKYLGIGPNDTITRVKLDRFKRKPNILEDLREALMCLTNPMSGISENEIKMYMGILNIVAVEVNDLRNARKAKMEEEKAKLDSITSMVIIQEGRIEMMQLRANDANMALSIVSKEHQQNMSKVMFAKGYVEYNYTMAINSQAKYIEAKKLVDEVANEIKDAKAVCDKLKKVKDLATERYQFSESIYRVDHCRKVCKHVTKYLNTVEKSLAADPENPELAADMAEAEEVHEAVYNLFEYAKLCEDAISSAIAAKRLCVRLTDLILETNREYNCIIEHITWCDDLQESIESAADLQYVIDKRMRLQNMHASAVNDLRDARRKVDEMEDRFNNVSNGYEHLKGCKADITV